MVVPASKPNITIRGVDRNAVVLDGGDTQDNGVVVQERALIVGNTVVGTAGARVPLNTPLAGFYGIGIAIAGGNRNYVLRNTVTGRRETRSEPTSSGGAASPTSRSQPARAGNCFRANRAARTLPAKLHKRSCSRTGGSSRVSQALELPIATMIARAVRALRPVPYTVIPAPPPQPNRPG